MTDRPGSLTERRRVLRVIARLNVGGPSRHVMILDRGLRARGWDSLLVHGSVGEGEASMDAVAQTRGVLMTRIPELGRRLHFWGDAVAFVRLLRVVFHMRPEVVHTHTAKAGTLGRVAAGLYNVTRRRRDRCAIIHTFHGHVFDGYFTAPYSWLARQIESGLARFTDRIVTISERQRVDIVDRYRVGTIKNTVVVPLGLELDSLLALSAEPSSAARRLLGIADDAFVVALVGRVVPIKRPFLALDAFERLCVAVPRAVLLVVGDGPLRAELEMRAQQSGLRDRMIMAGWRNDLENVYAAADVVALSSRNEGTPVALIEAMASARAVAATAVGGVPDLVVAERGILVPRDDASALAAALEFLAGNPDERRRLGCNGRRHVTRHHTAARLVDDIEALYAEVVAQKRRGGSEVST
jgi:glycosyltransferase involved in cell wall biosynthesis